ncbi:MAG TPA: hypothetical protein VHF25_13915 [Nitriliruptorales bacterium]|nr:hypothetical protein [Nitriliruptorales bacterium]
MQARAGTATVALAPVVILAAFLAHPFLVVLPDAEAVAAVLAENPTRWAVAHLLTAIGSALIALAFLAVRVHLRNAGQDRFSPWGVPFVVFGSVLYAVLPGLEFAPLTAAETGGDIAAVQAALQPWFIPIFVTGAITFAIGIYAFARAIADSAILGTRTTPVVVTGLAVLAGARAVPLGVVQFHVQAIAGVVALWPLAAVMWRAQSATASPRHRPSPAT